LNTFTTHVPNLITLWVLIAHKVTVHKCSKSPPPESMHAWTSLIMDYHILLKFHGRLWMVWQTSKRISAISPQCQMELNTLRSLSVSTDKIRKNCGIFFAENFYVNFSLVWGAHCCRSFKHFTRTLYFMLSSKDI